MARNLGPQCRLCRAEHKKLFLKGTRCYSAKCPIAKKAPAPGKGPKDRTKKLSDYGLQLREKQRLKRMYGLLEKQFKNLFVTAEKLPGGAVITSSSFSSAGSITSYIGCGSRPRASRRGRSYPTVMSL
jgi:ribosomal protein S4